MKPENQKLLPCPFCGGKGFDDKVMRGPAYEDCPDDPDAWAYFVRCRSCAAHGGWAKSSVNGGRSQWNRRISTPDLLAIVNEEPIMDPVYYKSPCCGNMNYWEIAPHTWKCKDCGKEWQ